MIQLELESLYFNLIFWNIMAYQVLNTETLKSYIHEAKALRDFFNSKELDITEVGDGNLNFVFIVKQGEKAIVIKQATPYLRCAGEDWKLSRDRMLFEIGALEKFHVLVPEHVPFIYHKDPEMSLVAMQYLGDHIIMRKGLIASKQYPNFSEQLSHFLAETLFKTSSFYLNSSEKRKLEQEFSSNHDLCKLTEEFVFTFPYLPHDSNSVFSGMEDSAKMLYKNKTFKKNMMNLKYSFMNQRDALLHGDLHTGSLMVNANELFVIDPEFAFVGPFGFDLGAVLANLLLAYVAHTICDEDDTYSTWLLTIASEFMTQFEQKFLSLWRENKEKENALIIPSFFDEASLDEYRRDIMKNMLSQSIGFAGAKMCRRILGIAGVADIRDIADPQKRLAAEKLALALGTSLVERYDQITSMDQLIELARSMTQVKAHV